MKEPTTKPKPDAFGWVRKLFSSPPKTAEADSRSMVMPSNEPVAFAKHRGRMVLVVDDDPLFVKVTSSRLQANGYDVITATDSGQAMEALRCKMPDVVVLDVNLPDDVTGMGWDGLKLVAWLNRLETYKKIPVVIVTASDPSKYTRLALNAGATAFYHKQMEPAQLLTMVENCLARNNPNPADTTDPGCMI